jgi:hypothetical protein
MKRPLRDMRIWVKTWGEIVHDAEHRLKYVQQQLGVAPDQRRALEYLRGCMRRSCRTPWLMRPSPHEAPRCSHSDRR